MRRKGEIVLLLLFVAVSLIVCSCGKGGQLSDEDRLARQDDRAEDDGRRPEDDPLFPDSPTGRKLQQHMKVLALPAETLEAADRRYAESLAELRSNPAEAVKLLSAAYENIEEERYFERWGLVKTMGDLRSSEAHSVLSSIARSAIPPERSEDLHHFSTQDEEQIIRVCAVEGLATLASLGHKDAESNLLTLALDPEYPYLAVKTRAIKGYLRAGRDTEARIKLLKSKLPENLQEVVTLDVTQPEEFQAMVNGIASVSPQETNKDAAEERLPEDPPPVLNQPAERP